MINPAVITIKPRGTSVSIRHQATDVTIPNGERTGGIVLPTRRFSLPVTVCAISVETESFATYVSTQTAHYLFVTSLLPPSSLRRGSMARLVAAA